MMNGSKEKNASTKQQILKAAIKLFAQQGYDATTTRLITEQVGVSQSAISFHFNSKEKLCKAAAEYSANGLAASFEEIYGEIETAFAQDATRGDAALALISKLLKKQISFAFDPRNRSAVSLALNDKSLPSCARGILPAVLFEKFEAQLTRLLLAYSNGGSAVWAQAVSRAADGAIFAFFEKPSQYKKARPSFESAEVYVLDFLIAGVKRCAPPGDT